MKDFDRDSYCIAHHRKLQPSVTSIKTIIRKLGRNKLSIAISLLILAIAALALYYALRDIDVGKVMAALRAQPRRSICIASIFVVAGYVTLIFYDVFALRTIGHGAVPFRVAAVASFTSYTIGHALGAATLTGGFVRLRVYSAWGLDVLDIAKIAFVTGMTFWLGNALVLGGALCYAPQAASGADHLPPWANFGIGLCALLSLGGYLIWLMPTRRTVGYSTWQIALPNARLTLVQTGIGAADLCLVTAAMYMLLPDMPPVGFATLMIIFLTATLIGTISHVPGNLGIIEAAMLIGLPQFGKEELLASLLTFRVLYFAVPLLFAMFALALRELGLVAQPSTTSPPS
jgi:glycosyltransferase 2 family protein